MPGTDVRADSQAGQWLGAIAVILLIAAGMAWAGSQGSVQTSGVALFALCGGLAFVVNWAAFVPAWLGQTERYYDLTGSLTYLSLIGVALALAGGIDLRAGLLGLLVATWAVRLGRFLFKRVNEDGSDGRFDVIKPNFARFLMTWSLQALWVFVTLSCALAAMTSARRVPLGAMAVLGSLLWLFGFVIEVIADRQKRVFRADTANAGRFITSGLWAWSRHPNYFGEILLWLGISLIALPALSGWQWLTLVSPVFVYILLTRISGVPMLESRAKKRWGEEPEYRAYKRRTPSVFLRPPRVHRAATEKSA
jgi:steroid 5-alpha reductase family enzyme